MATIEIKDSNIDKLLKAIRSSEFYTIIALGAQKIIKDRTRRGKDVQGKTFQQYSEGYKKLRSREGLPVSPVTLTFDDIAGMMKKIDHIIANDFSSVAVLIDDPDKGRIAKYHHELGAGKSKVIRRFWGIELASEIKKLSTLGYNKAKNIIQRL